MLFVLIFRSWDVHVNCSVWDAFWNFSQNLNYFMQWGIIKHCCCVLVWKLNWILIENSREYYCLNIIVNISSFSYLNTDVNTALKYYCKQALNKELKLMGGVMKFFAKKVLVHEIFSSTIPWATEYILKNL